MTVSLSLVVVVSFRLYFIFKIDESLHLPFQCTVQSGLVGLNRTEFIGIDGVRAGPDLPQPLKNHCIIQINDDQVLVTGGSLTKSDFQGSK